LKIYYTDQSTVLFLQKYLPILFDPVQVTGIQAKSNKGFVKATGKLFPNIIQYMFCFPRYFISG